MLMENVCLEIINKDHPEYDGSLDVYDHSEFKIVSNCCYPNFLNFVRIFLLPRTYRYRGKTGKSTISL